MSKKRINENPRSRDFLIELYPDNESHISVLEKLQESYNYVGIVHNKDVYEKERKDDDGNIVNSIGDVKKEHMHIIVSFSNQRYLNGVAKELELDKRFIQKVDSFKKVSRYLIHLDNEEKAQYTLDEIFGSLDLCNKVKKFCTEEYSITNIICELVDYLDSLERVVTNGEIARVALSMGYIAQYNRFKSVFNDLVYEHNENVQKRFKGI